MKTRTWILILGLSCMLSLLSGVLLLHSGKAVQQAEIYSSGKLIASVSLLTDQEFTVSSPQGGSNTIRVQNGKIAVISATCPDHYCMKRGYCNSGASIICLPNALEIRFSADGGADIAIG